MIQRSLAALMIALPLGLAAPAVAQGPAVGASYLRSDWTLETTRAGQPHVVGYLYNSNIQDAANVWLRVEQLAPGGGVAGVTYRRVVGDVLSGDRLIFDVPVPQATANYRVAIQWVDWVKECR